MSDQKPKGAAHAGEPGTVAVTVEGRRAGSPPTYRADLAGTPPRLRVTDLDVTYVDRAGLKNYRQIRVTDCGIEKTKGVRATDEQVARTVEQARAAMAQANGK